MGTLIVKPKYWTPRSLDTALWLDAADSSTITTVSGGVSEWRDKSGNVRHVSQANSLNRPTRLVSQYNGLDVVNFWGNNKWLGNTSFEVSSLISIYCVLISFDKAENRRFFELTHSTLLDGNIYMSDDYLYGNIGVVGYRHPENIPVSQLGYLASLGIRSYHRGSTSLQEASNNGSLTYNTETGTTTTFTSSRIVVGGQAGSINSSNVHFCELIFTPFQASIAERQKVEGYLAHKWGLIANLPADHPYKNRHPRGN